MKDIGHQAVGIEAPPPPGVNRTSGQTRQMKSRDVEQEYRDLQRKQYEPQAEIVLELMSERLRSLEPSSRLMRDLRKVIDIVRRGEKHRLFHEDAPARPRRTFDCRRQREADAAVVLQRACDDLECQSKWAEKIAEALDKSGMFRQKWGTRPPGRYSGDTIIKWRNACMAGTHPESKFFAVELAGARDAGLSADWILERCFEPLER